jgi:hypothetical protein
LIDVRIIVATLDLMRESPSIFLEAGPMMAGDEDRKESIATLGGVIYAKGPPPVPERDWTRLVDAIADGDHVALHSLYERANRIVFTLALRLTANPETAEEVTIDVFYDIWRRASNYDAVRLTGCASTIARNVRTPTT